MSGLELNPGNLKFTQQDMHRLAAAPLQAIDKKYEEK
jgi:hypothetical protein